MISGIGWVSEVITAAGGTDVFQDRASASLAKGRIIENPMEVVRRRPDIMLGSWCGKKFQPQRVWSREGWDELEFVRERKATEIPAEIILQPGPAALTEGIDVIHGLISDWSEAQAQRPGQRSGPP